MNERDLLDRVTRVPGVRGALLVAGADGLVVAEQLMDGVDGQRGGGARRQSGGAALRTAEHAGHQAPRLRPPPRARLDRCSRRRAATTWSSSPSWHPTPTWGSPDSR